jgi:hypothetical protein
MKTGDLAVRGSVRRIWLVLVAMVVLLFAFVIWKSGSMAKQMSTMAASNEQEIAQSAVGAQTKFVLEVGATSAEGRMTGNLLEKKAEEIYARTTTPVTVQWNAQTKIVMAKMADVHAGAVVHVTGTVQKDHSIDAEQIVILTGYVKVQ